MELEKNLMFEGTGAGLGTNGEGIVRMGSAAVFVPGLLPEERAVIKILKVKGNVAYGKVEELLTPAEDRVRTPCPVFLRCGGCQLQHMRYRMQLNFKSALVADALRKIGNISYAVPACRRSEKEYGYRNKLQLPVGRVKGENAVGFYAERSHRIVPAEDCALHPAWAKKLIAALKNFMEKCGLDGYDEETGEGQIRHIVVRELKGNFLVTLVVTTPELNGIDYFLFLLNDIFPEYSFYLNVNASRTNVVFGEEFLLKKGAGVYECDENGVLYEAGPNTFVQVNDGVRAKLYEEAAGFVQAGDAVVDCYSGGGLLTALFAKKCGKAYGIEIVPEAHACAEKLKEKNGLNGCMTNICGSVEENLSAVLEKEPSAVVVLDPPRAGVDRSVLKLLIGRGVKKIMMISCNPASLARDLGILTGSLKETASGELLKTPSEERKQLYSIEFLQPFDMFPQTKHVETLVWLTLSPSF